MVFDMLGMVIFLVFELLYFVRLAVACQAFTPASASVSTAL